MFWLGYFILSESLKQKIDSKIAARMASSKKVLGYEVNFDFHYFFSEVWQKNKGFDVVIGNPPYVQIQKFSGQQIQKDWEKQKYKTFAKTGDIYCLFYEKGDQLLRDKGCVCLITSNKWMLANYGKKMRNFLAEATNPLILFNFGSYHIFESATVDTNILLFEKGNNQKKLMVCAINDSFGKQTDLVSFFQENHIVLDDLDEDSWIISSKAEVNVKKRIEEAGVPLKDWQEIGIYYGIKTGFNDAFIIDGKMRAELIAKNPKSVEILKPVLNGKDIKRYRVNFNDKWLVFVPWHFPLHEDPSVKGASIKAEEHFRIEYREVFSYLESYKEKLSDRNKSETGIRYEWYALQRCAASYYPKFAERKVVWGNLALSAQFALGGEGVFLNAPSNMLTGGNTKYFLALLNSTLGDYYIRSLGVTRNGGYFEYKPMFVEKLPVPQIPEEEQRPFIILVEYLLLCQEDEYKLQAAYFEQLIDGLVYELYFPDELKRANKELAPHMGELKPLDAAMFSEEKLAIIQSEFDRLYDPEHPVRNNLETLDSVNEVRIIQEAVQK